MIQNLKNKLINVGGIQYEDLIRHINAQGDKINELVHKVNKLDNQSSKSTSSDVRLIDANGAKKAIKEVCDKYNITCGYDGGFGEAIANVVDSQPTVKINEPMTSTWRLDYDTIVRYVYICNNCNFKSVRDSNYCPECGCMMKGTD